MSHDELRSLKEFIPAKRIEFWMGFGDRYLNYFNVMRDIGLLSPEPLTLQDGTVVKPASIESDVARSHIACAEIQRSDLHWYLGTGQKTVKRVAFSSITMQIMKWVTMTLSTKRLPIQRVCLRLPRHCSFPW